MAITDIELKTIDILDEKFVKPFNHLDSPKYINFGIGDSILVEIALNLINKQDTEINNIRCTQNIITGDRIKIINILNIIACGKMPPKRIKYDFLEEKYNVLVYNETEKEYTFENDPSYFWSVPNHHLNDEVEILER